MSPAGTTSKASGESIRTFKLSIKRFNKIGIPRLVTLAATKQARATVTLNLYSSR